MNEIRLRAFGVRIKNRIWKKKLLGLVEIGGFKLFVKVKVK